MTHVPICPSMGDLDGRNHEYKRNQSSSTQTTVATTSLDTKFQTYSTTAAATPTAIDFVVIP